MYFGFVPLNGHNFRFECNEVKSNYVYVHGLFYRLYLLLSMQYSDIFTTKTLQL